MKKEKYILLIFALLCFAIARLSAQCTVDSIGIKNCVFGEKEYVIPVYVGYTGTADSIKIEATGLDYTFQTQYFRMFQHFINPSNINTFHFPIYDNDTSLNNVDVKVTLIGNTCNQATDFLMQTLVIDSPSCFCSTFLVLSGQLNESKSYYVETYISSTQEILTGNEVLYSAKTYVDIGNEFKIENGSTLDINFIGCTVD